MCGMVPKMCSMVPKICGIMQKLCGMEPKMCGMVPQSPNPIIPQSPNPQIPPIPYSMKYYKSLGATNQRIDRQGDGHTSYQASNQANKQEL